MKTFFFLNHYNRQENSFRPPWIHHSRSQEKCNRQEKGPLAWFTRALLESMEPNAARDKPEPRTSLRGSLPAFLNFPDGRYSLASRYSKA